MHNLCTMYAQRESLSESVKNTDWLRNPSDGVALHALKRV